MRAIKWILIITITFFVFCFLLFLRPNVFVTDSEIKQFLRIEGVSDRQIKLKKVRGFFKYNYYAVIETSPQEMRQILLRQPYQKASPDSKTPSRMQKSYQGAGIPFNISDTGTFWEYWDGPSRPFYIYVNETETEAYFYASSS